MNFLRHESKKSRKFFLLAGKSIDFLNLAVPFSAATADEFRRNSRCYSTHEAQTAEASLHDSLKRSEAKVAHLRYRKNSVSARRKIAESFANGKVSLLRFLLECICLTVVFAGDAIFANQTLAPLIGISPDKPWASLAIALAVVAAVVGVERLMDPLLTVLAKTWNTEASPSGRRLAAGALLASTILLMIVANLDMVIKIAQAREESSRILMLLSDADSIIQINEALVRAAIVSLSVVIVINAAVLLRAVLSDLPVLREQFRATFLRRLEQHLAKRIGRAEAEQERHRAAWDNRKESMKILVDAIHSRAEWVIQHNLDEHRVKPLPTDAINWILSHPRALDTQAAASISTASIQ